jgi:hypothetical protein
MIALLVATAVLIAPAAYPDLHAIVRFTSTKWGYKCWD